MTIYLVRHAAVDSAWAGRCYGCRDVALSADGAVATDALAAAWPHAVPTRIVHSGLSRTRRLAEALAARFPAASLSSDVRLRERDYGTWQGRTWDAIYADHPDMHNVIHQPSTYNPYDGETTTAMQQRVAGWLAEQPSAETTVAVTHSGPIAALAGHLHDRPATEWTPWMLPTLGVLRIDCDASGTWQPVVLPSGQPS